MKNRIKGFTLIECIVALAVFAIATLTMAQIYAGVARINRNNQIDNTSISNQVADIEKKTDTQAVAWYYGETNPNQTSKPDPKSGSAGGDQTPPHDATNLATSNFIKIEKDGAPSEVYSFPVDLFVFESRDNENNSYSSMPNGQYKDRFNKDTDKYSMRYKYIAAHNNEPTT